MMATRRIFLGRGVPYFRNGIVQSTVPRAAGHLVAPSPARFLSQNTGGKGQDPKEGEADDPFGVNFEDGADHGKFGPSIPPKYKRDAMTGKFTGETESELSARDKEIINMDILQEQVGLSIEFYVCCLHAVLCAAMQGI